MDHTWASWTAKEHSVALRDVPEPLDRPALTVKPSSIVTYLQPPFGHLKTPGTLDSQTPKKSVTSSLLNLERTQFLAMLASMICCPVELINPTTAFHPHTLRQMHHIMAASVIIKLEMM